MADHRTFDFAGREDISSEPLQIKIEYNYEKIMDLESFRKKKKLPTIYRVPDVLHKMNERAYTPSIVAIGPLHREKKHLQAMEEEKRTYMNFLFYRTGNVQQTRYLCSSAMLEMVSDARRCYADDVRLDDFSFAEMMLVDGCFMIELFYRCKLDVFDPILKNTFKCPAILKDLILLENQIPFEVLDKLFQLTVELIPAENTPSLTECVLSLYWDVTSPKQRRFGEKDHKTTAHVLHLLHSCHLQLEEAALPPKEAEVPSHHLPPEEAEYPSHHFPPEEAEVLPKQSYNLPWVVDGCSHDLPPMVGWSYLPQGKEAEDPSHHLPPFFGWYYLPQGKEEAEDPNSYCLSKGKEEEDPSHHLPQGKEVENPSHHLPPVFGSYYLPQGKEEAEDPNSYYLSKGKEEEYTSHHLPQGKEAEDPSDHLPTLFGSYYLPQRKEEAEDPSSYYLPQGKEEEDPSHHLPTLFGSYYLPKGKEAEDPSHHLPPQRGFFQTSNLPQEKSEVPAEQIHDILPPERAGLPRKEAGDPSHHLPQEEAEVRPKQGYHLRQVVDIIRCSYQPVVSIIRCLYPLPGSYQLPPEQIAHKEKKKEYSEAEMVLRNFKYSATELDLGGIKFEKLNKKDIFRVEFLPHVGFWRRGQFKIPPFLVDDFTELFWRNFIAFEQSCHFITKSYFTSHALLMDRLVNTTEDVQLLEEKGIIVNTMGSPEEVANLFNNLCNNIHTKEFNSTQECKKVIDFHKQLWPKFLVKLRRDYFSNPWTAISVLAAISLFVLTLLQTIYTMRS